MPEWDTHNTNPTRRSISVRSRPPFTGSPSLTSHVIVAHRDLSTALKMLDGHRAWRQGFCRTRGQESKAAGWRLLWMPSTWLS